VKQKVKNHFLCAEKRKIRKTKKIPFKEKKKVSADRSKMMIIVVP
jgi:hypothetical protein